MSVAYWSARRTNNPKVVGSNPTTLDIFMIFEIEILIAKPVRSQFGCNLSKRPANKGEVKPAE